MSNSPRLDSDRANMAADQWTLKPHPTIGTPSREHPLLVCVLDGWGEAPDADDNAIYKVSKRPTGLLRAEHGLASQC